MKSRLVALTIIIAGAVGANAQAPMASSHASAIKKPAVAAVTPDALATKPAAKVNGTVVTESELRREMLTIFPYAQQHNNTFPKDLEPEIRRGALEMIIFEELLYQEGKRLDVAIAPEKLASAEKAFRRQFDRATYNQFLRAECNGSQQVLREKIRRSLLIEKMVRTQVQQKAVVTVADAKAYYDKNPKQFQHGETVSIQTISIIPP